MLDNWYILIIDNAFDNDATWYSMSEYLQIYADLARRLISI